MFGSITPEWYAPISTVLNLYVAATSIAFLLWLAQGLRKQRNLWALVIAGFALYTLSSSGRGLWVVTLRGLLPRFSSSLDAASAFAPTLIGAIVVTGAIVAQLRDRKHRAQEILDHL